MAKDVYPQMLKFSITQSSANTYTEKEIPLPVQVASGQKTVLVMEILKIYAELMFDNLVADASHILCLSTISHSSIPLWTSAGVFARFVLEQDLATSGAVSHSSPLEIDLTDGQGNGFLVAVDKLYLNQLTVLQDTALTAMGAILYRIKSIPSTEYIGIVQSQIAP